MYDDELALTERVQSLDLNGRAAYRIRTNERDLTTTLANAIAEVAGVDPVEDDEVLYHAVDPDALEMLFADRHDGTPRTRGKVVFEVCGCRVEVTANGDPLVYEPREGSEAAATSTVGSA